MQTYVELKLSRQQQNSATVFSKTEKLKNWDENWGYLRMGGLFFQTLPAVR
jgi:hypothetical protein